jgi:hypothetical protein
MRSRNAGNALGLHQNAVGGFPQGRTGTANGYGNASNAFPQATNAGVNAAIFGNAGANLSMGYAAEYGGFTTGNAQMSSNPMSLQQPAMAQTQPPSQMQPNLYCNIGNSSQHVQPMNGNAMYGNSFVNPQQLSVAPGSALTQGNLLMQGNTGPSLSHQPAVSTPGGSLPVLKNVGGKEKKKRVYKPRAKRAPSDAAGGIESTGVPKVTYSFKTRQFAMHIRMNGKLTPTPLGDGNDNQKARLAEFVNLVKTMGLGNCPLDFVFELDRSNDENIAELMKWY